MSGLENQLKFSQDQVKGLTAQLEAVKQMFNNSMAECVQLRANIHLMNQTNQELAAQVKILTDKISALEAPKPTENLNAADQICQ